MKNSINDNHSIKTARSVRNGRISATSNVGMKNIYGDEQLDLDKDILFKGNTVYSPETCCFVLHIINTVFINGKSARGDLPMGVSYGREKKKYRACAAFMGQSIKLGRFNSGFSGTIQRRYTG